MGRLSNRRGTVGTGSVLALQLAPRHYFYDRCNEILGARLHTIHNLHYYLNLMQEIRSALENGSFAAFQAQFAKDRARGV